MSKSLVIVESPAKVKTISKYLGDDFLVESCIGHIRDLPKGSGKIKVSKNDPYAQVKKLGMDPTDGWKPTYEILDGKEEVVKKLVKLAKTVDTVYLASDPDREGEAIAWHLQQVLGGDPARFKRVTFHEITKNAITESFKNPGVLDMNKVNAQQTRRFLDKLVGYLVSPVLWLKVAKNLSAGRVQSVAVELIVDREREINAFRSKEYWDVLADMKLAGQKDAVQFELCVKDKFDLPNEVAANQAIAEIEAAKDTLKVSRIEQKEGSSKPSAPFITSTLQQTASTKLGFSVKHTMAVAQMLYEAGYITYMRTDSFNLSNDAVSSIRNHIENAYGKEYLPAQPNRYARKDADNAQEAHEAIRTTNVDLDPSKVSIPKFAADGKKLYALIRDRSIACQMTNARYLSTTAFAKAGTRELKTQGRVTVFDGWTRVIKQGKENALPAMKEGDALKLEKAFGKQHFTLPPARYTEAGLVKELESRGIGRPSTYAEIISKIQERGYVKLNAKKFHAEKIGEVVVDRLKHSFCKLMEYGFTSSLEDDLDKIAEGKIDWIGKLDTVYENLSKDIEEAKKPDGMPGNKPVRLEDLKCPSCGRPMEVRIGSNGLFLGCSGYADKDNPCSKTMNLNRCARVDETADDSEIGEKFAHMRRCPKCGSVMDEYLVDANVKLYLCSESPACEGHAIEQGDFDVTKANMFICDKCGQPMTKKVGRFGPYAECTNPDCGERRSITKSGQLAPPKEPAIDFPEMPCEKSKGAHYVLRISQRGLFFAAHDYPKHKETRTPRVEELAKYRDRLPEKLQYICDAPKKDPDGNPTITRFSLKTKQTYVGSLGEDGKATKWQCFYADGKWTAK